jgi:5-methylcytosine-specific restriction endonuclease McrA
VAKVTKKTCLTCKGQYIPNQPATQKYCSRSCKNKARSIKLIADGVPRKGGYNRSVYIRVWMKARSNFNDTSPFTAKCTYCGRDQGVDDNFTLDHRVPRGELTYEQLKSEEFLVLACYECNQAKGEMSVEKFLGEIE